MFFVLESCSFLSKGNKKKGNQKIFIPMLLITIIQNVFNVLILRCTLGDFVDKRNYYIVVTNTNGVIFVCK